MSDDAVRADKRRAAAEARAVRAAARAAARAVPPQRSAELHHLTLGALRTYRSALTAEEDRVSYWRRILQARLDSLYGPDGRPGDLRSLTAALSGDRVVRGRTALVRVVPVDDIPPLPDLAALWERSVAPGDDAGRHAVEIDLQRAETELSAYRAALHKRIETATNELIARYRDEPDSCLSALPSERLGPGPSRHRDV